MPIENWRSEDPNFSGGVDEGLGSTLQSAIQCFARQAEIAFRAPEVAKTYAETALVLAQAYATVRHL